MNTMAAPMFGNRYVLQQMLGEGGMGSVYRALDRLTAQTVALKRVHLGTTGTSSIPDQDTNRLLGLAREFQTLASLRHPNIIGVLDYGFDRDGQPYFTMELLDHS